MMSALDSAIELLRHGLLAIADAEHRDAGPIDLHWPERGVLVEYRSRPAGKNDPLRLQRGKDAPLGPMEVYRAGVPVLGICYGEQAMAQQLDGRVEGGHHREFGRAEVEIVKSSPLTDGVWEVGQRYPVWMSHGDRVTKLPPGFVAIGTSANAPIAMIADEARKFYATQFHLEVVHTPHGAV